MRGPRRRAVVTIRIVINQPCARINRDVTTLFCRSFAFPLALSFPFSLVIRESRRLFRRNNDSLDTRRQANSKQRHLKKEQTEKFVLGHLSMTFFGLFKRLTRSFVHNKFYKRERIVIGTRDKAFLKKKSRISLFVKIRVRSERKNSRTTTRLGKKLVATAIFREDGVKINWKLEKKQVKSERTCLWRFISVLPAGFFPFLTFSR